MSKPVAYRHMLRIESHDAPRYEFTATDKNPFGVPGKDYDEGAEYKCEPLWSDGGSHDPTDFALGGKIYWRELAMQLSTVWWELSKIGGNLQHGDLESAETCFSVVLEQHGGQCFHADTPMDAWENAKTWLMSPNRLIDSPWTAKCDTLLTQLQSVIDSPSKRSHEQMAAVADRLTAMAAIVSSMELR